jgi:hypothetical protein
MKIPRLPFRPWSLLVPGVAWALALALSTPLPAAESGKVEIYEREYMLRQLSSHEAEVLLWDQCPKPPVNVCRVRGTGLRDGMAVIVVYADDATHARIARALAEHDVLPATHAFQVVLLLADRQPGGIPKELPANTQKALQDVVGFLPFTRFRVLDSGWVRTAGDGQLLLGGLGGPPIQVALELGRRGGDQMYIHEFQVAAPIVPSSYDPKDPKNPPHWPMRMLINTAFGIKLGETLVVGTSKLDGGDEALVALVSAVE